MMFNDVFVKYRSFLENDYSSYSCVILRDGVSIFKPEINL